MHVSWSRPPSRTLTIARLADGEIRPLIGTCIKPHHQARQEMLSLWENLSIQGRKAVLTAVRLTAREEGYCRRGSE